MHKTPKNINLPQADKENCLLLHTLGGIHIHAGDTTLSDDSNRSLKLWSVLCYLILHRDRAVTQAELIDIFWTEEDRSNPLSALKMLILRIRSMLKPVLKDDTNPILGHRGAYQWNPAIPCQVDVEIFEQLCTRAHHSDTPPAQRMNLYSEAMEIYQGDFLPKQYDYHWVLPLSSHYQNLYLQAVKIYAEMLENAGLYEEMNHICLHAIRLHPLDEQLHILLIRSYLKQRKNSDALRHYERSTKLLYQGLGIRPSEQMQEIYLKILSEEKEYDESLDSILYSMSHSSNLPGAFECQYGIFQAMYQIEVRRSNRTGSFFHLALLTLSVQSGRTSEPEDFYATTEWLLEVVIQNLRRSDIISRYSKSQFLILLSYATLKDSIAIMERILSVCTPTLKRNGYTLSYKIRKGHP